MTRLFAIFLLGTFAAAAHAHPFDDRAEMYTDLILIRNPDGREAMRVTIEYVYEGIVASYTEVNFELDKNGDGTITRDERDRRFQELNKDIQEGTVLKIHGTRVKLVPDYSNFLLTDMRDPDASVDNPGGMPAKEVRLHYFFAFDVEMPWIWERSDLSVEFYWSTKDRVVMQEPVDQLRAWDDRGPRRRVVTSARHDKTPERFPRLTFLWNIESMTVGPSQPGVVQPAVPDVAPRRDLPDPDRARPPADTVENRIEGMFNDLRKGQADPWVWMVVLGSMFLLGAYHAVQPGHGKTLVAGYLIGTQGTSKDAVFLGVVVTAAHTSGVLFLLGAAWGVNEAWPGALSRPGQQIAEWITLAVGGTILLMGISLTLKRSQGAGHAHDVFGRHVHPDHDHAHDHGHHHHAHDHGHAQDHGHHHTHDHDHSHVHDHSHDHGHGVEPHKLTRWEILRLGILGGVVPCPSAFVIALIAFQQQWYFSGLVMVVVFSLGLAVVLAAIGLVLVHTKGYLNERRASSRSPVYRWLETRLPVFGALMITMIGTAMVLLAAIRLEWFDPASFSV